KLLGPDEVIDVLKKRPKNIEVVLTGRGAPGPIIDYADLVTEMRPIKHPFDKGLHARKGIEF
ncbi:MAG: cob(I)yrinic acid a,c-diamide adenosyltransferase, partial [Candidatus Methanoplasma sp.]|nr:cob(I)yrinic acid a,c-diamide adenosyltransferase [Candidatus Methanoplasma sp.]